MGKIPGRTPALSRPTPEKTPENQAWKNLARPLRRCLQRSGHKRGIPAAKQERRKKMEQETTNLFRRTDTLFGICEGGGRVFGRSDERRAGTGCVGPCRAWWWTGH